jgi:hypothetical protein
MDERDGGETAEEAPRQRGRPRRTDKLVFFRSKGRVKAYDPEVCAIVNTPSRLPETAKVYDGMGYDWCSWKSDTTRAGDFNAARRSPFRRGPAAKPPRADDLEPLFDLLRDGGPAGDWLTALADLFDGVAPTEPVILSGIFWVRFLSRVFLREAGEDGIDNRRYERPEGKAWASVNVLPDRGGGYNYTESAWFGVANMVDPPAFVVKVEGLGTLGGLAGWRPEELADAVLWSLRSSDRVDSCAADLPPAKSEPQSPAIAPEAPAPCQEKADAEPLENRVPDAPSAEPVAEVRSEEESSAPPPAPAVLPSKTWGEYKAGDVWLKGLTTSKELQAPMPLAKVVEMVTAHEVTRKRTEACRAVSDKKARNEWKRDKLHVWYASALFSDRASGSNKANVAGYTGLACLDFDGLKSFAEAQDVRDDLFLRFPEVLFSAVSASGLGVYVLVALDFDGTEEGYRTALAAAMCLFEAQG